MIINGVYARNSPVSALYNNELFMGHDCYSETLQKILLRFRLMTQKHDTLLLMKFDLRLPYGCIKNSHGNHDEDSIEISDFFQMLEDHHVSLYGSDIQYVWIRDHLKLLSMYQYRCMVLMSACGHEGSIDDAVYQLWSRVLDCSGSYLVRHIRRDSLGRSCENGIVMKKPSCTATGDDLKKDQYESDYVAMVYFLWGSYLAADYNKSLITGNMKKLGCSVISDSDHKRYLMDDQNI